eukprot:1194422-Prorocentrum_minimum.AAC.1
MNDIWRAGGRPAEGGRRHERRGHERHDSPARGGELRELESRRESTRRLLVEGRPEPEGRDGPGRQHAAAHGGGQGQPGAGEAAALGGGRRERVGQEGVQRAAHGRAIRGELGDSESARGGLERRRGGPERLHGAAHGGAYLLHYKRLLLGIKTRRTPRLLHVNHGHAEGVKVLIEAGAHIDRVDMHGATALIRCIKQAPLNASQGHMTVLQMLLDAGASVNTSYMQGTTGLHIAAQKGHKRMIEALVKHGADRSVKDDKGETAWDIAKRHRMVGMRGLLEC